MPPLEALPTPGEEVLRRGVQSLISFTSSHPPGPAWGSARSVLYPSLFCVLWTLRMSRDGQQALSARGLCGPLVLLALLSSSRPSPPPWPSRHFFLHPPRPAFSHRAVRPPFGDLHGCPPLFGWRSRYGCVNLDVAVALPVPAGVRASVRVIGSVSVVPSCPAVALSARAVRDFAPPACRPSVSSPAFVVIVAVAKALRSLDSLVFPSAASSQFISSSSVRVVVPSPSSSLSPLSIVALPLPSPPSSSSRLPSSRVSSSSPSPWPLSTCSSCPLPLVASPLASSLPLSSLPLSLSGVTRRSLYTWVTVLPRVVAFLLTFP